MITTKNQARYGMFDCSWHDKNWSQNNLVADSLYSHFIPQFHMPQFDLGEGGYNWKQVNTRCCKIYWPFFSIIHAHPKYSTLVIQCRTMARIWLKNTEMNLSTFLRLLCELWLARIVSYYYGDVSCCHAIILYSN